MVEGRKRKKRGNDADLVAVVRAVVALLAVLVLPAGYVIRGEEPTGRCAAPAAGWTVQ